MKKRNRITDHPLLTGELYLFHPTDCACPATGSLFGIFDKSDSGILYLESSSSDFIHFRLWHRLSDDYCCCRRASRRELRDYIFNLASYESHEMQYVRSRSLHAAADLTWNPAPIYEDSLIGKSDATHCRRGGLLPPPVLSLSRIY